MLFWILTALVTVVGLAAIMRPLLARSGEQVHSESANLAIYKDQLGEIERDEERGLLNADEAKAARLEVSRRILAIDDGTAPEPSASAASTKGLSTSARQGLAAAVSVVVVALTVGGYLVLGAPGLPGQPHAERARIDPSRLPVEQLIARVEARLQAQPEDGRGWDVLAPIYLKRGAFRKAARAYEQSIRLNGESDRRLAQFAEAILGATNGQVNDAAKLAYERLLKLRPDYLPAHFWLAVRQEQVGKNEEAAAAYRKLLARDDLPKQMRSVVGQRLASVGGTPPDSNSETKSKTAKTDTAPAEMGRAPMLTPEARQTMAALTPQQRQARIGQMVEGLAARLDADGGELSEWQRLIRSYVVLGNSAKAQASLEKARKALAGQADVATQLEAFAASLGLPGPGVKGAKSEPAKLDTAPAETGRAPMLTPEMRQTMAALPPQQRQARIGQMVEGLAARLDADGGELSEWQRLIRAYVVLGNSAKAQASLAKARKALAGQADVATQLEAFAASLGLPGPGGNEAK